MIVIKTPGYSLKSAIHSGPKISRRVEANMNNCRILIVIATINKQQTSNISVIISINNHNGFFCGTNEK